MDINIKHFCGLACLFINSLAFAEELNSSLEIEELRAQITASHHATLSAEMTGKILSLLVREGTLVHAGQKLIEFKCDAENARLSQARIETQIAENKFNGTKRMAEMDAVGTVELENSRLEVEKAKAQVELLDAVVGNCTITAPYDGTISDKFVNENEFVETGKPLIEIQNNQSVMVEFIVPSSWLSWLKIGYPLSIYVIDTKKIYQANIGYTSGKVDALSQSIKVFALLNDTHKELLPGMSGRINIKAPSPSSNFSQ
ncbi:efflux RND transporter periplasmic adaptor subunit [Shewanella avicenniae]|uniref:Efflux RND transporter periplasmic adaptor subunit n=1 Tax=Shewanella avicenniae TaxID=2814294 RepID=A0ABX7QNX3_9GAMM|nr:efflux RND transporter periplasmic adaptor subunit [Shewanella avicenniae]QSX32636.1 efflux RND transporter periplasmic adaptor subunit [Shewanella avicenniae]